MPEFLTKAYDWFLALLRRPYGVEFVFAVILLFQAIFMVRLEVRLSRDLRSLMKKEKEIRELIKDTREL